MRLVVDTNILLTYFWDTSLFRRICKENKAEFFTPEFALKEIKKHEKLIAGRIRISTNEFSSIYKSLFLNITVIDTMDYAQVLQECRDSVKEFSESEQDEFSKGLDFLAVSVMLCCPLWSNDKLLAKQDKVTVLKTKGVVTLLDV
jgi:predicted nucleic acid-binding protein